MAQETPSVPCDACRNAHWLINPRQEYYSRLLQLPGNNAAPTQFGPAVATRYDVPLCIACKRPNVFVSLCADCHIDRMDPLDIDGPEPPMDMCTECAAHSNLVISCTPHQMEDFPPDVCGCGPARLAAMVEKERQRLQDMNPFLK